MLNKKEREERKYSLLKDILQEDNEEEKDCGEFKSANPGKFQISDDLQFLKLSLKPRTLATEINESIQSSILMNQMSISDSDVEVYATNIDDY